MNNWPDFKPSEFKRCTPSCELSDMNSSFMDRLQTARTLAGVPFKLNSAYRSVEYEHSKKRTGKSMHCQGRAVDIKCVDSHHRYIILEALIAAGFKGIGIAPSFIHVDDRDYHLIWTY